jgi:hypothetical protein
VFYKGIGKEDTIKAIKRFIMAKIVSRIMKKGVGLFMLLFIVVCSFIAVAADNITENITQENTPEVKDKLDFALSTTMIIGIILAGILIYFAVKLHLKIIKITTYIIILLIGLFIAYSIYHYSLI